jgi:hypothetical protein
MEGCLAESPKSGKAKALTTKDTKEHKGKKNFLPQITQMNADKEQTLKRRATEEGEEQEKIG